MLSKYETGQISFNTYVKVECDGLWFVAQPKGRGGAVG